MWKWIQGFRIEKKQKFEDCAAMWIDKELNIGEDNFSLIKFECWKFNVLLDYIWGIFEKTGGNLKLPSVLFILALLINLNNSML